MQKNATPDPLTWEIMEDTDIIEQYEEIHFPIGLPTLQEMIELRMLEMELKQKDLATPLKVNC